MEIDDDMVYNNSNSQENVRNANLSWHNDVAKNIVTVT